MAPVVNPGPEEQAARKVRKVLLGGANPDQWAQLDELVHLVRQVLAELRALRVTSELAAHQDHPDRKDLPG
jgi:hypothetical protein